MRPPAASRRRARIPVADGMIDVCPVPRSGKRTPASAAGRSGPMSELGRALPASLGDLPGVVRELPAALAARWKEPLDRVAEQLAAVTDRYPGRTGEGRAERDVDGPPRPPRLHRHRDRRLDGLVRPGLHRWPRCGGRLHHADRRRRPGGGPHDRDRAVGLVGPDRGAAPAGDAARDREPDRDRALRCVVARAAARAPRDGHPARRPGGHGRDRHGLRRRTPRLRPWSRRRRHGVRSAPPIVDGRDG